MNRIAVAPLLAAFAIGLAGCKPTTIVAGPQNDDANFSNAQVVLPPPVKNSAVYRCDDNSVYYVDFLADGETANLRTSESAPITRLAAPAVGKPFEGGGFILDGDGQTVKLTAPHKDAQSCKS